MIIEQLKRTFIEEASSGSGVSARTKFAQGITKKWQEKIRSKGVVTEVNVSEFNNERIDVIDSRKHTAYELKVSGKNPHHEFYKDLCKVITFNANNPKARLSKFVFITERDGIANLTNRLDPKFMDIMLKRHKVQIILMSI